MKDEKRIKAVKIFNFDHLPADVFTPYKFEWTFLQDQEKLFNNCITETHTYKKYEDYSLDLQFLGTTPEARQEASPVNFVHAGAPYSVFIYTGGDFYVDPKQHHFMIEEFKKYGISYEVIFKEYYAHSSFMQTDMYELMLLK